MVDLINPATMNLFSRPKTLLAMLFFLPMALLAQEYQHYNNHHDDEHHEPAKNTAAHETQDDLAEETGEEEEFGFDGISKDSLSKLKAVIISAEVDGVNGANTLAYKERMKSLSDYLKWRGVRVREFFCPDDDWTKIVEQAVGAHILIYSGHGVYDGSTPPAWVGGFSLTKSFVTSKQIQEQLKLAPNAVVIFNQACFTAGSSAGDKGDIGLAEAHRRVAIYAHPFIDKGVGCYYASNFNDSGAAFLDGLFRRKTARQVYRSEASSWSKILEEKPYDFNKLYSIGISRYGDDQYSAAYVGKPGFTAKEWFKK
jgi:hypothetical protein